MLTPSHLTWTPRMCQQCGKRPAILVYEDDWDDLWACDECMTACGSDCCGVCYWSSDGVDFETIVALWAMSGRGGA